MSHQCVKRTNENERYKATCAWLSDGTKITLGRDGMAAWLEVKDTPIVRPAVSESMGCEHCPGTEAEGHREYCPRYTGPDAELAVEIEGFKTFKYFSRHLCRQIVGLGQDLALDDPAIFGQRLRQLHEIAQTFLLIYGTGEPAPDITGVLTEKPPGPCSVCKAIAAINCSIEGCPHRPAVEIDGADIGYCVCADKGIKIDTSDVKLTFIHESGPAGKTVRQKGWTHEPCGGVLKPGAVKILGNVSK